MPPASVGSSPFDKFRQVEIAPTVPEDLATHSSRGAEKADPGAAALPSQPRFTRQLPRVNVEFEISLVRRNVVGLIRARTAGSQVSRARA